MKILHAGNMINLGYFVTKHLRHADVDAELIMEQNPPLSSDPRTFDFSLNNQFPSWISFYDKEKSSWKFDLIKKMRENQFDLVHAYVELPIFSYISRKPFIVQTQGSDFRELAFSNSLKGILLRRAYKKAKLIILSQADHTKLVSKLKLNNSVFLPIMWDTDFFKPISYEHKLSEHNFVIFHPTRQNWNGKKNNVLIEGFAKFVKNNPDSFLVMMNFGPDNDKVKELVSRLNIEKNVKLISERLDKKTLLEFYNRSDVIADQFGISGSIGATTLEAMSCKKPVLMSVDKELHQQLYGDEIPAVFSSSPSEIFDSLEFLKDIKSRSKIETQSREWVLRHHSPENIVKKMKIIYESIMNKDTITNIREKLCP